MDKPAFPQTRTLPDGSHEECEGLTMRDYFAAKVMQSFTKNLGCQSDQKWFDGVAEGAYRMADAMLKARQQ